MSDRKACPFPGCGKEFKGPGWLGIDGHWRSPRVGHEDIESYENAKKAGLLLGKWQMPDDREPPPTNLKTALRAAARGSASLTPLGMRPQAVEYLLFVVLASFEEFVDAQVMLEVVDRCGELLDDAEKADAGTDERVRKQIPTLRALLQKSRHFVDTPTDNEGRDLIQ